MNGVVVLQSPARIMEFIQGAVQISGLCDQSLVSVTQLWFLWLCESGSTISSVLFTGSLSCLPCCWVPAVPLQAFLDCLPLHPVFCCPAQLPPQEAAVFYGSKVMFSIRRWHPRAHDFSCQPGQQQHDFLLAPYCFYVKLIHTRSEICCFPLWPSIIRQCKIWQW